MPPVLLGRKIGMTRTYDDQDRSVPVTVIQADPSVVSQVKTVESDGYEAIQLAFGDCKARASTMPLIGHDAKAGAGPKRHHREVRLEEGETTEHQLGQSLSVELFEGMLFVDVIGTSKGKGFAGPMKRHGFKGQEATHGVERKHRSPGAISGRSSNLGTGKPKKGIRMGGHMGQERVTVRSLPLVAVDKDRNLLLVKGPVPGANQGLVMVREAVRLSRQKARLAKAS